MLSIYLSLIEGREGEVPKKRYIVTLTAEERSYLRGLINKGTTAALSLSGPLANQQFLPSIDQFLNLLFEMFLPSSFFPA